MQHPWVTVVCAAVVVVGVGVLPNGLQGLRGERFVDVCGVPWHYVPHEPGPLGVLVAARNGEFYVAESFGELAQQIYGSDSEGNLWSEAASERLTVAIYDGRLHDVYRGMVGFTTIDHERSIGFSYERWVPPISDSDPFSAEQRPKVIEAVLRHYEQSTREGVPQAAAKLREYLGVRVERRWAGYMHTSAVLLAVIVGFWSLGWVERVPGWLRERQRGRALAAGRCSRCGYSLAGLVAAEGTVCPECGERIGMTQGTQDEIAASR